MERKIFIIFLILSISSILFASKTNGEDAIKLHKKGQYYFKNKEYNLSYKEFSKEVSILMSKTLSQIEVNSEVSNSLNNLNS